MKKLVIGVVVLIVLLIGAILIIPSLVPSDVYKETIQNQLTQELDREVRIDGEVKLSVFPSIKARTEGVNIANPEGFNDPVFASMDSLEARIKLLPLLSKRVEIKAFELISPQINLEKLSDGRANWEFGETEPTAETPDAGPFKRDGRYANIDPAIGKFSLQNGAISYVDATSGQAYTLKEANLAFTLPSLTKAVTIDGDVIFNDEPVDLKLTLDSPRAFLDGKIAPLDFDIKTSFADIGGKGQFLESEAIAFDLNLDGQVTDVSKLAGFIPPMDYPIAELAKTVRLKGAYRYDGKVLTMTGADIGILGPLADFLYKGDAKLDQSPVLDGNIDVDVRDLPALTKLLKQDIQNIDLAKTLKLTADLNAQDAGFAARNINANITGEGLTGSFKGTGQYDQSFTADGEFSANAESVPGLVKALALDIPQAGALGSVDAEGRLSFSDAGITLENITAKTSGDHLNGSFSGNGQYTDSLSLTGDFDAASPSVPALTAAAQIEAPQANALGAMEAKGQLTMIGDTMSLRLDNAEAKDGAVNAGYIGTIDKTGDAISLSGAFTSLIPSAQQVAEITGMAIPYADVIGQLNAKGNISGPVSALKFSGIDASMTDGQLNGQFTGDAALKNGFTLSGNLAADIPSARNLAARTGTELPPSTTTGTIYENVAISGAVTGNPDEINFKNAELNMDAINGTGDFKVDLTKGKPEVTGNLDLGSLDLRPYMAAYTAQRPEQGIQPWSETPINFNALKAINGTFRISTPEILMTRLNMGQTDFTATIRDGVLTAKLPKLSMYGGLGTLTTSLDASQAVPVFSMDVKLDDIRSNTFLGAVANYTSLTGEGHTLLDIKGQGQSQADIMRSLSGQGDFKVVNGELAGIDLGQFMTGLDSALTSRAIPKGLGREYKTKFNDIVGLFKIKDGVVSIDNFNLIAPNAAASGVGKLDLGRQTVDFSFRPRLTGSNASDLASFGIPLKLSGSFNSVSAGLDSNLLGQIVAERAQAELTKKLTGQVGGGLGDVVGGLLGGEQTRTETTPPADTSPVAEPSTPAQSTEPEDVVTDLIGGLLGGGNSSSEPEPAPTEDPNKPAEEEKEEEEEPTLEDALGSLFGKKKKND